MTERLNRLTRYIALSIFAVGVVSLLFGLLGLPAFDLGLSVYSAILFLMSGAALFFVAKIDDIAHSDSIARAIAILVIATSLCLFICGITGLIANINVTLKLIFTLVGFALLCLSLQKQCIVGKVMSLAVLLVSLFNFFGMVYGFHQHPGTWLCFLEIGMAESIFLIILGLGLIVAREDEWLVEPILSRRAGGVMARRFLPIIFVFMLVAWLRLKGEEVGLYSVGFGLTIMVFFTMMIMLVAVLLIARRMNDFDMAKERAREDLVVFRKLIDSANDEIFIIDSKTGNIIDLNDAVCVKSGYLRDEILKMKVEDFEVGIKGFSWTRHVEELKKVGSMVLVGGHKRKDGSVLPVELNISSAEIGDRDFVIAFARDITERNRAEQALHESEDMLRVMTESASDAIIMLDAEGLISFWNRAAEEMLGYSASEIIGKNCHAILAPQKFYPAYERAFPHFKTTGEGAAVGKTLELEAVRKNGEIFPIELSVAGIKIKGKWHAVGIMRDVSVRKHAEEEIKKYQLGLEELVEERTASLLRAQTELMERETRLRILTSNITSGMVYQVIRTKDGSRKFTFLSASVNDLYGCTPEEGMKDPNRIYGRIHEEDRERLMREEEEAFRKMSIFKSEARVVKPSGKVRWSSFVSTPNILEDGSTCWDGIEFDITERKKIEIILSENENKYRALFDHANDAIFLMSDDKFIDCNEKTLRTFGVTRDEIIGESPYRFSPQLQPDGRDSREKALEYIAAAHDGKPQDFEWKHSRLDGTLFDAEVSLNRIDLEGKVFVQAIVRDITERKLAEKELSESEEKYRMLVEKANDAVVLVDVETLKFVEVNNAFANLIGRSIEDIVGSHFLTVHPKGKEDYYRSRFKEVIDKGSAVLRDLAVIHKSGKEIPVQISASILNLKGRKYVQGMVNDVSAYKATEDRLERQLEDARRLSDIGALAATVAHELRNPLGVIRTAAYNIDRKANDPELSKHVANIDKKILESDRIIKNLLTYSRIKLPQYETVQPVRVLDECLRECQEKFKLYDIKFTRNFNCDMDSEIEVDPLHLTELFSNLLDNACQSLAEKKGNVDVKAEYIKDSNLFRVTFKDDGEGISDEDLAHIYEPFFTRKAKGIGLGLTVCNQVVGLHQGKLDIQSKKDEGTVVIVELPIGKA